MRLTAFFACLLLAVPAASARQRLDTLSPAQAISRAASASPKPVRALFQFKVQAAAKSRDSAANLGVAIKASAMPGLTKKYGDDLKAALVGKTVKIIGHAKRVSVGKNGASATRVEITHAGQILSVS